MIDTISRSSTISFPLLGGQPLNPPASFTLFGREIYFYGVIIALAFMAGLLYAVRHARFTGIQEDDIYDVMLGLLPMSILGARLYYVLFRLDYYWAHPGEILAVWEGGLAIYGGILAGALTVFLVCRRKKIPFFAMGDLIILGCMLGQAIGRWGNFMNREAFGAETMIFCHMGLTDAAGTTIYVHPTFLYESLWNLAGFAFLSRKLKKRSYDGQCMLGYFLWYGLGRAWIESLRTDSLMLGNTGLRASQLLSLILVSGSACLLLIQARKTHDPFELYVNRKNDSAPKEDHA